MSDKKTPQEEYVPRMNFPRSLLRQIECPLEWNPATDYHALEERRKYEDNAENQKKV